MKLFLAFLLVVITLAACNMKQPSQHEAQWSQNGKDSVVYVQYRDENGSMTDFYMNYLLFNSLFRSGGYSACYNYHVNHPQSRPASYSSYRPRNESGSSSHSASNSSSSPSRSYSSPSRSSSSSSPSRSSSSPTRSYSSPSRSYSSPSRSYSSPSRSYSSPSRSYTSPSRH